EAVATKVLQHKGEGFVSSSKLPQLINDGLHLVSDLRTLSAAILLPAGKIVGRGGEDALDGGNLTTLAAGNLKFDLRHAHHAAVRLDDLTQQVLLHIYRVWVDVAAVHLAVLLLHLNAELVAMSFLCNAAGWTYFVVAVAAMRALKSHDHNVAKKRNT